MATKISKRLYIGLGGTGVKTLIRTKKMFEETYGEIPPSIRFLGIDTDMQEFTKEVNAHVNKKGLIENEKMCLSKNEQVQLKIDNPNRLYEYYKEELYSWMPQNQQNLKGIATLRNAGAGQIRSNGRFVLISNAKQINAAIKQAIIDITNARNQDNKKYEIESGSSFEIHIVFSICGGTGSGTFIDVAYIARDAARSENVKIMGYAMLAGIFENDLGENQTPRVKPNAYGALLDLDWLMSGTRRDKIKLKYQGYEPDKDLFITNPYPFDAVTLIDGVNKQGMSYDKIDQLTDVISLALVTNAGCVDSAVGSALDNVCKDNEQRAIYDKEAWGVGMGISELVFRGENVGEVYAIKAAKMIILDLLNTCTDANGKANAWIDEVAIREHDKDDVIDFIKSPNDKRGLFEIDESDYLSFNIQNVNSYVEGQVRTKDMEENRKMLSEKVEQSFKNLYHKLMNDECGVGGALAVMTEIDSQVQLFLKEMNEESDEFTLLIQNDEEKIKTALSDLKAINALTGIKAIGKSRKQREKADEIQDKVILYTKHKIELARRKEAIVFFNMLKVDMQNYRNKAVKISDRLKAVDASFADDLAMLQNVTSSNSLFQIDLSDRYTRSVTINKDDIRMDEFIKKINHTIDDFDVKTDKDVKLLLMDYTHTLNKCKNWTNKSLESVLDELKANDEKNETDQFDFIMKQLKDKSQILFDYNGLALDGLREMDPAENYYVGVENKDNSAISGQFEKTFTGDEIANKVNYVSTGMKNRIIIYHLFYSFPPYVINSVNSYVQKYKTKNDVSFHIDAHMERDMQLSQFKLTPSKKTSQDESLELWVKGLILEKIKNENSTYFYYDKSKKNHATTKGWIKLADNWRDKAFEEFSKKIKDIKDDYLEEWEDRKRHNLDGFEQLLEDVRNNYFDNYSQVGLKLDTINKVAYAGVNRLLTDELTYVSDKLK